MMDVKDKIIIETTEKILYILNKVNLNSNEELVLFIISEIKIKTKAPDSDISFIGKLKPSFIYNIGGNELELNSKKVTLLINNIVFKENSINLSLKASTSCDVACSGNCTSNLCDDKVAFNDIPFKINNISGIYADSSVVADLLNNNIISYDNEEYINKYNIMPKFKLISRNEEDKRKVKYIGHSLALKQKN